MEEKTTETVKKGNVKALLPIGVFLVLYLGLGILFEYGMGIPMGFYNIPVVVIFLVALLVACFQNRKLPFDDKLTIMGRGMGDKTIVTMVLIFMVAGIFVGTVGRDSAESVAYLLLSVVPVQFAVAVLFVVSCFVSLSMGTSVGTITLITPIAVAVSSASGFSLPLCVASVMGGAMFGDNLSFISDTTIAACQGQGCQMKDKFRENFKIALPAAIVSLVIILALSFGADLGGSVVHEYDLIQLIPYLIVLVGGIIGVNDVVTREMVEHINENKQFIEVVIAPDYEPAALELLQQKKNVRVLRTGGVDAPAALEFRSVDGGMLAQQVDRVSETPEDFTVPTKRKPTPEEMHELLFAWRVCKGVKSNAILVSKDHAGIGMGPGQPNRVDSAELACKRAHEACERMGVPAEGLVAASDAFFPFRDNIDTLAGYGVTAIIQPGGSIRDEESIQACDEHGIAMVFTGHRHFRH